MEKVYVKVSLAQEYNDLLRKANDVISGKVIMTAEERTELFKDIELYHKMVKEDNEQLSSTIFTIVDKTLKVAELGLFAAMISSGFKFEEEGILTSNTFKQLSQIFYKKI